MWTDGFSELELARIILAGELTSKQTAATVAGDNTDEQVRKSKVSWLEQKEENIWLYDKVGYIVRVLNGQFFRFDLTGFAESFQYTTYDGDGEHYDWHMDKHYINGGVPRKLSVIIQLSDPSEYEGGILELYTDNKPIQMEKKKGLVVVFPSYILHRVTPVTSGTRRSLVIWTGGPAFR